MTGQFPSSLAVERRDSIPRAALSPGEAGAPGGGQIGSWPLKNSWEGS